MKVGDRVTLNNEPYIIVALFASIPGWFSVRRLSNWEVYIAHPRNLKKMESIPKKMDIIEHNLCRPWSGG